MTRVQLKVSLKLYLASESSLPCRLNAGIVYVTGTAHTVMFYVILLTRKTLRLPKMRFSIVNDNIRLR